MNYVINNTRVRVPASHGSQHVSQYESVNLNPGLPDAGSPTDGLNCTSEQESGRWTEDSATLEATSHKNTKLQKNIITCKKDSYIGTLNVRTIRKDHTRNELAHCFAKSGLTALGIQEHRIVHTEETKSQCLENGSFLITSPAWRNGAGAATGGVGFILNRLAHKAICKIIPINNRILLISFNGNPKLTMMSIYSPTEAASDEEAEEFYNTLRSAINTVPDHHLLVVTGDFNAHLGKTDPSDSQHYFYNRTNRNGRLLRDTAMECELEITNLRFRKNCSKKWTYLSDCSMTKSQLDFVLVRRKWRNSVKDTVPVNTFNSVGSDHRAVITKLRLSLRKQKRVAVVKRYNYGPLKGEENNELQNQYAVEVHNKFNLLLGLNHDEIECPTSKYEHFVNSIQAANEKLLQPADKKLRTVVSNNQAVVKCRKELYAAKEKYTNSPSDELREQVAVRKVQLEKCYHDIMGAETSLKVQMAENASFNNNSRVAWQLINDISGRKAGKHNMIEGENAEKRLDSWKSHFQKLLGQPPAVPDENLEITVVHELLDIRSDNFDRGELAEAKTQIKEGKAFGEDGIAPEIIKRVDIDNIILNFCNDALNEGNIPEQWGHINIVPVPKSGNLSKPDNYRGIALTSIVTKTLNKMILNRIKPYIDPILRDNQNGFRSGRSTTSHILTLRRIIEEVNDKNLSAVLLFVDFKKAFDSVHRGLLMKILRAYGIPNKIVTLIAKLYENTTAKVITEDGLTEAFLILAGVMQGDTLAPYLFIIVIDYIMRTCLTGKDLGLTLQHRRGRRYPAIKVTDADYADDVALITDTAAQAQEFLQALEVVASSVGLHLNESKTKFIGIHCNDTDIIQSSNGSHIEQVEDFKYLGAYIGSTIHDWETRKAKAWAACHQLKNIWKSNMSKDLKVRTFQATVEAVLLYGAETWTVTKTLGKRIDGTYTRMLRMVLGVSWKDKLTNKELYGNLPRVTSKIQERRMKLSGHIQRHQDLTAHHLLCWKPTHGHRNRGRPKTTYTDLLLGETGAANVGELQTLMQDRKTWRSIIRDRTLKPP